MNQKTNFLTTIKHEINFITWPSRSRVLNSSVIILILVILSVVFIGVVDFLFTRLFMMLNG